MTALIETVADGVASLTLNRPERHNAFDEALVQDLLSAFMRLQGRDDVRVVVLASVGSSFCAGGDLGWLRRAVGSTPAENLPGVMLLAELLHTIEHLPKPTVALVQGPAYGGGVGLAACCDIVIASDQASFQLGEVRLGLAPATVTPYLVRAIGARQARRLLQTAESLSAAEAYRLGLVHEVTGADGLSAARDRVVDALLKGGPAAQAEAKALIRLAQDELGEAELMAETSRRDVAHWATAEAREGVAAFLEKRIPAWRKAPR